MQQLSFFPYVGQPPPAEYRLRVQDMPSREQPANRLREVGPGNLSTIEVLAVLLGTPRALDDANQLLQVCDRSLHRLYNSSQEELTQVPGIGKARAAQIHAALELGRRMGMEQDNDAYAIRSPADAASLLMGKLSHLDQEHFVVLCLDTRNRLVHSETVYKGSVNGIQIRVAEILRPAITRQCPCIVTSHNHPSGDCTPSPEDRLVVSNVTKACKLMDMDHLDHIVIGRGRFVSMRERGLGFA